jgi:hypothetical protein
MEAAMIRLAAFVLLGGGLLALWRKDENQAHGRWAAMHKALPWLWWFALLSIFETFLLVTTSGVESGAIRWIGWCLRQAASAFLVGGLFLLQRFYKITMNTKASDTVNEQ